MISPIENLILINNKIRTTEIAECWYRPSKNCYIIIFKGNQKEYTYGEDKIIWLKNPDKPNPCHYRIFHNQTLLINIESISIFKKGFSSIWHIRFMNGSESDYNKQDLKIIKSCLNNNAAKSVFEYIKEVATANTLCTTEGIGLLAAQYKRISFISEERALAVYLNPEQIAPATYSHETLIYPFGSNSSQLKAVRAAFENQISIIQGPPGTGKTQTILNIIANILTRGKTVQVVSNNNSAITNVLEKLVKYDMGFIVATLGNAENKQNFIDEQRRMKFYPPTLSTWQNTEADKPEFLEEISQQTELLSDIFLKQERLAIARQELRELEVEWEHYRREVILKVTDIQCRKPIHSSQLIKLWNEYQLFADQKKQSKNFTPANILQKAKWFFLQMKSRFYYGIYDPHLFDQEISTIISALQGLFYETRNSELHTEIQEHEKFLSTQNDSSLTRAMTENSLTVLRNKLFLKYGVNHTKPLFDEKDLKNNPEQVLAEYPVILSTTFSSRSSLHPETIYDYLIMDEASQVSIETGVLALSCARNVIIVGDSLQLPNVVTDEDRAKIDAITRKYNIHQGYDCAKNSFLQSVCEIIPDVPQTLLREHYRCHPKIINFCNQKFYGGKLVIMTKDNEEKDVICAIKTAVGNHSRNQVNQREIDVIKAEVLPHLSYPVDEIGIISPYNKQVNALKSNLGEKIDVATVHKFQGREKDAIIMSTVDDEITPFADDPNLLNVAVSRAKQKFQLVVSGNPQPHPGNISDLISYIEYQNCTVTTSKIHSIYDLLYKQYTEVRLDYLRKYKRISAYDSENLTYALILDILQQNPLLHHLNVICHQSLKMLIRDFSLLNDEERRYAMNNATHLDFLIYNRVSKQPILAIETDGYAFHKQGGAQYERDRKKDRILHLYGLPLVRLNTTGNSERRIIEDKLKELLL